MLRITHLSDLHLQADDSAPENHNAQRIVEHIVERYAHAPGKTVVTVTGDCLGNASEAERQKLIELLHFVQRFFTVIVVPGNHDCGFAGLTLVPGAAELFRKVIGVEEFPTVWHSRTEPVDIIGLDSSDPEDEVMLAQGVIGQPQLSRLSRLLYVSKKKRRLPIVALHHHPFCRDLGMPLVDSAEFMNVVSGVAGGLIFGHKHVSELRVNHEHIGHIVASGKVTEADHSGILRYRILTVERGQIQGVYTEEIAA